MKKIIKLLAMALVVLSLTFVFACAPSSSPTKARDSLEKNGYSVALSRDAFSLAITEGLLNLDGDLVAVITAAKEGDAITIIYFEEAEEARECFKLFGDDLKDFIETETDAEILVKQSGKMIYIGTKAAIKAA